ncbi:tyrosine-type recombinase/integrase [Roseibium sp.]|uniref:tyrosine-type recombinase/integrase n=1 Tax=Roseibium sp. TaxID=1936156 RepID=UPI003BAACD7D
MSNTRKRISKSVVDKLEPGELVWDSEVRGFGVRCQRKAKKYVLKTRVDGRQRWFTIGEHGSPWTADTARKEALRLLGSKHAGASIDEIRKPRSAQVTMADLCDRFIEDYARQHKKASSVLMDEMNIRNHVLPLLGKKLVTEITRSDIDTFKLAVRNGKTAPRDGRSHGSGHKGGAVVSGGEGVANRCLALLSKMFNLAERWELRPDGSNPVRHIEKYRENKVERYLTKEEFARLASVLEAAEEQKLEDPFVVAAIRLLIFTGARLGEILSLKWEYVDYEGARLLLPDSKTGRKTLYLNSLASEVLTTLPRIDGNPFVIVGKKPGEHLVNLRKPWYRIRKQADIEDVRIHDLRHSFASFAVAEGLSLPVIGKLLGHKKASTTERYAHLADDPIRSANERVAEQLAVSK